MDTRFSENGVSDVLRYRDCSAGQRSALVALLARFGLNLELLPAGGDIPGSFWGDEEAGLLGGRLLLRGDTPLHSVLHEACHFICMDPGRRADLDTDAGGGYDEENAVCYLSILLARELPGFGDRRMMVDMDAWGYRFRLGSARDWFERDADDARRWLRSRGLIDGDGRPAYAVNTRPAAEGD